MPLILTIKIPTPTTDPSILCFLMVLALFQLLCFSSAIDVDTLYPNERDDLLKLRDSTTSSYNLHRRWTGPPCIGDSTRWVGIGCSDSHVVSLVLDGIQLTGSLPDNFLANVPFLTRLSLRNNSITGPLPALAGRIHLEEISLSSNNFSGSIPAEYVDLPRLTRLELQGNSLTGGFPPFDQRSLVFFNVSYNQLKGPIPNTSAIRYFPTSLFDHNPGLCGIQVGFPCPVTPPPTVPPSPSPPPIIVSPPQPIPTPRRGKSIRVLDIVLIAISAALAPFLVMGFFLCCYRKVVLRKEERKEMNSGQGSSEFEQTRVRRSKDTNDAEQTVELEFFDKEAPIFDLDDLLRASAEVLGKGKLGTTYKAVLESGSVVTTKRLKNLIGPSKKEFLQQMHLLGFLRHENIAEIISYYFSKDEKLVIYEFVPDGNLFDLLHGERGAGRVPLNCAARISIIKAVAKGLHFLHQALQSQRVPHANLKSTNVLIQQAGPNYRAKLVDYGFLPLLPNRKLSEDLSIGKTPEFRQYKKMTYKADVYCFGLVVLEIVTGRVPGEVLEGSEERFDDISEWVREVVNNDWSTDVLDEEISGDGDGSDEMMRLTELALECTDEAAEKRPRMDEVLRRIQEIEQRSREELE